MSLVYLRVCGAIFAQGLDVCMCNAPSVSLCGRRAGRSLVHGARELATAKGHGETDEHDIMKNGGLTSFWISFDLRHIHNLGCLHMHVELITSRDICHVIICSRFGCRLA